MIHRIISLIIKELLEVWRDNKSRLVIILPPLSQLLIFSYTATLEVTNISLGIFNEDSGIISTQIIDRFVGSKTFDKLHYIYSNDEIKEYIDTQKVFIVVHFNQDFSQKVLNNQEARIQVILDGRKSNTAQIVLGYISQIINKYNQEYMTINNLKKPNSIVVTRHWFNPNLEYTWFTIPGLLAIISLTMGIVITGLTVARERELGTFDQLMVSPLQPFEILIGKTVPGLIIGIIEATIMFLIVTLILGVPFTGSIFLLYFSMFIFLLSVIGFGLFISSISKTQQQAILGSFLFMPPAILLSGFTTPIENMPEWLQPVTIINPLRYFLVILRGLFLKDIPTEVVIANLWPLVIISSITLVGAVWFFKRRLE